MTTVLEYGGGLEKYLIETAAHLARRPGVTVDVITLDDNFTKRIIRMLRLFYFKPINITLSFKLSLSDIKKRLGRANYYKLPDTRRLREALSEYDVVYSKNELLEAFLFKYFVGFSNIPPIIFGGHTALKYPKPISIHGRLHNFLYTGPLYRFLASRVAAFHVLNNYEYAEYVKLFPGKHIYKIYNPFDLDAYRKSATTNSVLRRSKTALNILWVGRLTEQKGVSDLVELINNLNEQKDRSYVWHIVGDGEDRSELDKLSNVCGNIFLYGHLDPVDMPVAYRDADVFLCTSRWEGYPYAVLEARAFRIPIIAVKIPGVEDIVKDYSHGILVESPSELSGALSALIGMSKSMTASSDEDAFKPDAVYEQLIEMFEAIR